MHQTRPHKESQSDYLTNWSWNTTPLTAVVWPGMTITASLWFVLLTLIAFFEIISWWFVSENKPVWDRFSLHLPDHEAPSHHAPAANNCFIQILLYYHRQESLWAEITLPPFPPYYILPPPNMPLQQTTFLFEYFFYIFFNSLFFYWKICKTSLIPFLVNMVVLHSVLINLRCWRS